MNQRFFDVVVLGRSVGALVAAALLARRDFRVLVLGQRQKAVGYRFERHELRRRAFTLTFGQSPVFRRVLQELAQTPRFRRVVRPLDPMFQVLWADRRMEVPPDPELFGRELERELPEVRQQVDLLYELFTRVNAAVDGVLEHDLVLPPATLWERFWAYRATSALPLTRTDAHADLFARFPAAHPFRDLARLPVRFSTALADGGEPFPALAAARLHGSWTRGLLALDGGEAELESFLIDRIQAHGGSVQLDGRATKLVVKRGRIVGVVEDGANGTTGCTAVLGSDTGEALADLASGDGVTPNARRNWPRVAAHTGRFVVTVIARTSGIPEPLAAESFLVGPGGLSRPTPRRPAVHLQRQDLPAEAGAMRETRLVAESLLPLRGSISPLEAREAVLSTLREALPYLDAHTLLIDSPHDGLPLTHGEPGRHRELDRMHVPGATAGAEPMTLQWAVEPRSFLDLAGEPLRGPIPGTFLVGSTVLPALGQEGELLAATAVARLITRADRTRQSMRRQLWSRFETP